MEEWTVERVKEELPDIPCSYQDEVFTGKVSGRKLNFAIVTAMLPHGEISYEVSWDTLVKILNKKGKLIF